jgi:Tubulin-tyrosine ligase family
MCPRTIAIIDTSTARILGRGAIDATLLRISRTFSRRAHVLVACWHQLDLGYFPPRLRPPFLEFEDEEYRVWCPRDPVNVNALLHFPGAKKQRAPLAQQEIDAEARFAALGIHCGGIPEDATAGMLYAQARRGIPTNAVGPLGRLGLKDHLEYGLRWYGRIGACSVPRPETQPCVGALLSTICAAFGGRDCIIKPANSSGGRYIQIVPAGLHQDLQCDPDARFVVQELECDPLLLGGFKSDLRCYLLVNSTDRSRSRRVGPILVRSASLPYTRSLPHAEITNTSLRRRLGLGPAIRPLENALAGFPSLVEDVRLAVGWMCDSILDFTFAWREEYALAEPPPPQIMLWGIDLFVYGGLETQGLKLLEINVYPQLYRNDELCDALVDMMLADDYLPELLFAMPTTDRKHSVALEIA